MAEHCERPILFSGSMVRAILDGRKNQTRRVITPVQPDVRGLWPGGRTPGSLPGDCPYGQPGDRLWVRETHWIGPLARNSAGDRCPTWHGLPYSVSPDGCSAAFYKEGFDRSEPRWRPSIHMPRWASRLTLEVTGVRVERLQDISEEDARAEGVERDAKYPDRWKNYVGEVSGPDAVDSFFSLWASIHGTASWDANPWVWVVAFRRMAGATP
ncbi:hypothetical protein [Vitiosangium sp. GDMCC 1.1324]|uniref:hypothetical protein n=1 Tax=Vitiosangium sp. (strain GDMCC 1.1324) TaxID=2138576 RepID=UPI000D3D76B3|nr:hypothetical protein [Vitiosangium sp. GDMCC 1.1324]PTL79076.1 hypothetical protein DAT35_36315 [Vitiosangium sp. GDMCC 1.1324]